MYLSSEVKKLEFFSANPGKVHFEGLVHLLRYIRDNKTFGLEEQHCSFLEHEVFNVPYKHFKLS